MTESPTAPTILLTGATGLVGRFVLRRLLELWWDVAVVVRRSTGATPQQRIEQVIQPFESRRLLRRPRVIEWDFANRASQVSQDDLEWLRDRRVIVVHCAASIRFERDAVTDEPYRTNVHGMRELLELCRSLQVDAFHQVSTAYVGSHRAQDVVREDPVAVDDSVRNDYEQSKIQAEKLVTDCDWIGQRIIHRPSIIVGDSLTAFSSTYHGFYAPLQIGMQYARAFGFSEEAGEWFREQLGLHADDSKNLVTVDWVAEGMVNAIERNLSSQHSALPLILHWTNPQPVACGVMQDAIVAAIERAALDFKPIHASLSERLVPTADQFRSQMQVYESYFHGDPTFDRSNVLSIEQGLHCPAVDENLLRRLADKAIENNFGWPRPAVVEVPHRKLLARIQSLQELDEFHAGVILKVQLLGPGSPESLLFTKRGQQWFRLRKTESVSLQLILSLGSLAECINGIIAPADAIHEGYWVIEYETTHEWLAIVEDWVNHVRAIL